jgi:cyclopropane fatty-acyl-phospholipid synthase-like methyltransferase
MKITKEQLKEMLTVERFPLSSKYDPQWMLENEMGPSAVWLTEWLSEAMDLKPGMRVLDMGCGKAMSSIFLAKEFGVQVWATDLWIKATDNWQRIREAGVEDRVFPIYAEAHSMPYADGFFDAAVSMDAYHYFGTSDTYLATYTKYVKPGGQIGIVVPGLMRDFEGRAPQYLHPWWNSFDMYSFHTVEWWRWHWEKTELVNIELADNLPDGWRHWLLFRESQKESTDDEDGEESAALRSDQGRYLGFVRIVARKR